MITNVGQIFSRPHISEALRSAVLQYPLVVLTAPVGYGKTMAARELMAWLSAPVANVVKTSEQAGHAVRQDKSLKCYYLPVSPDETSASYLWERQGALLTELGWPLGDFMQRWPFPPDTARRAQSIEMLRTQAAEQPVLLVVDDYHYAGFPDYNAHLEWLTKEAVPGFHLMLLSQTRPDMPLEELRLKGLCATFDQTLLAVTEAEAVKFFAANGISDADVARSAWRISEGWIAALWLEVQGYLRTGTLAPRVEAHNLLEHAVFMRHSEEEQTFLLKISILDRFTAAQAEFVSQESGVAQRLVVLCENNAFLQYDREIGVYRMHSLLRSLCASLFASAPADKIDKAPLFRRAGEWCMRAANPVGAIHFFAKAGRDEDFERILDAYEKPESREYIEVDPEGIAAVGMRIPPHVRLKKPVGYVSFLYSYAVRIDLREGLRLIAEAEQDFGGAKFSPEVFDQVHGLIAFSRGLLAFFILSDYKKAFALVGKARELLRDPAAISHKKLIWTCGSPHAGFLYLTKAGDYKKLVAAGERGWPDYYAISNGCGQGGATLIRAELLLETGNLSSVELKTLQAIQEAETQEQLSVIIAANLTLARLYMAQKRPDKALSLLDGLAPRVRSSGQLAVIKAFDITVGYVNAVLGRYSSIPGWLSRCEIEEFTPQYPGTMFAYIVQGKALLLNKQYIELLGLTKYMQQVYNLRGLVLGTLHSHVLEAIAIWYLYGVEEAVNVFQKAMNIAQPDGLFLLMAEYGNNIEPMLRAMSAHSPGLPKIDTLMKQAAAYGHLSESRVPKVIREKKLTLRERNMLDLVAKGKSSLEVAQYFSVKRVTVTKALGNAYRKLGVKNRAQAVRLITNKDRDN